MVSKVTQVAEQANKSMDDQVQHSKKIIPSSVIETNKFSGKSAGGKQFNRSTSQTVTKDGNNEKLPKQPAHVQATGTPIVSPSTVASKIQKQPAKSCTPKSSPRKNSRKRLARAAKSELLILVSRNVLDKLGQDTVFTRGHASR
ncbi:hypothetical protein KQX54_001073 [Cotesia glomerata]|uniref:Uncharacterized protein n=1 Tax=Cotesia glomerata TaxID=32391 RepID=A0AAV7J1B9_COTGL|nr:hypothetical protein KQX54_001073 [Cotesia glomerata]